LTELEKSNKKVDFSEFSEEALKFYKDKINFNGGIKSTAFVNKLYRKGLLDKEKDKFIPTGIGLILFGKVPEDFYPQAIFKGNVKYPNGSTDIQDFGGPLVFVPDAVENWWKKVMPLSIDRSSSQRKTVANFPYEPIREAVINALAHRDYDLKGAACHLEIDEHAIIVKSPGGPISPITLEQLKNFDAPTLSRNPQIFSVLAEIGMVERRGLGMKTYKSLPSKYNLPLPIYSFANPYLVLKFSRTIEELKGQYDKKGIGTLSKEEMEGVIFIQGKKEVTKKEYAEYLQINYKKAQRQLSKFSKLGIVKQDIKGPATIYIFQK